MSSNTAEKKGFFSKVSRFFKDIAGEMKKVVWPGKKQVINNTGIVIAFMVLTAIAVTVLDSGIAALLRIIFGGSF